MSAGSLAHLVVDSQVLRLNVGPGRQAVTGSGEWGAFLVSENCALYTRVPADQADPESQFADLREYATRRGWTVGREYSDPVGGKTGAGLAALMRDARRKRFDLILVLRLSRFVRSNRHLARAMTELEDLGIDFVSCQDEIETTGPCGGVVRSLFSALARLQQDLRSESSDPNTDRDESRKPGRPGVPLDFGRVRQLRSQGLSHRAIARLFGVSHSTIGRRLKRGR